MSTSALPAALREWRAAIGSEHVLQDAKLLDAVNTATFATDATVWAVLRPASREQVQECVRIANRHRVPIHPVSSGKNWGYGSRVPTADGVSLDLGRLNRILDFDEDLAYVTIEPGVTQGQLYDFLQQRKSRLWMDATGASPECSIIGNTMERGFGHTPMGDHCGNVCGFEVVLPTGEVVDSGFSRFSGAKAGAVSRYGVGPAIDGLFAQSNLGIVTRMTVWLMPAPEHFQAFFFSTKSEKGLGPIIDALRPLRLNGTLRSVMHIGNDYKVVAAGARFPWDTFTAPLDAAAMTQIRERMNIGYWNGSGGLYGTRAQVREARKQLRRALKGKIDRLQFVDDRLLRVLGRFARPLRFVMGWDLSKVLNVIAPVYGLLKGVPTDAPLESAYWRKRIEVPKQMDPDRDRCGLLWCSPVLPNRGSDVQAVTELATRVVLSYGFEPQMSLSLASERMSICVITISYDRDSRDDDARAHECYAALLEQLLARGYPPYRLNVQSMRYMAGDSREYLQLLDRFKQVMDPNRILAPGRYDAPGTATARSQTEAPMTAGMKS
jgi:4-cresol dehydrogenase (hydroxylating)